MINKLIEDFNLNTLDNFLQDKNRTYKPDPVDYSYYFESKTDVMKNFSDIQKRGEADVDNFGSLAVITAESKSSLSERSGKKIQFEIAKKILKESQADAAIFVFYDDKGDFRFSYINTNYEGSKRTFTSFKRYTYYVSTTQTNQTFKAQIEKADFNNIDSILEAFSVEPLNKEFYKNIQSAFYELVGGSLGKGKKKKEYETSLKLPDCNPNDNKEVYQNFAVRLIGRIIFVWFLKNKVSQAGKSLIPPNWLNSKNVANTNSFYHEYLEPLFFEVLNKWKKDRIADLPEGHEDIPFLNGGLFEAEVEDFYKLSSTTSRNKNINTLIVPDEWIESLFKTLEQYNFTIDENTLNDKEVSIDPEMLGTIFENLLAEIDPDTEKSARNSTGSFYTPREIVDYMVTESLVNYLLSKTKSDEDNIRNLFSEDENTDDIDNQDELIEALHKLKMLDPACGSGAFPMGVLQKMIHALQKLDPKGTKWIEKKVNQISDPDLKRMVKKKFASENFDFSRKMGVIQNSIYGVDIQPIATEISRLRCFLTIIVEERIDDTDMNRGIDPLPNLDFKFVTANSLKSLPEYNMNLFGQEDSITELSNVRKNYFACSGEEKLKLQFEFKKIQTKIAQSNTQSYFNAKKQIDSQSHEYLLSNWMPFENVCADWFDPKWMFGVEGFDIVIGNPPYFQLQKTIPNQKIKFADLYKNDGFVTFKRTSDIYALFYERGINLLNGIGLLCYITSNKWMRAGYGKSLRKFMSSKNPLKLIDMGPGVFTSATVDTNILLIRNNETRKHELQAYTLKTKEEAHNLFNLEFITINELSDDIWVIMDKVEQNIKSKIEKFGIPLKEWDIEIKYGIRTGLNDAYVINSLTKEQIINEEPKSVNILRPILRGRDIKRYNADFTNLWIILVHKGFADSFKLEYPKLYKHVSRYKDRLKKRGQVEAGSHHWIEIDNSPTLEYLSFFEKEKIIYPELVQESNFTYDCNNNYYCLDTARIITGEKLKYLVAILNSKLFFYSVKRFYGGGGLGAKGVRMKHTFFNDFHVKKLKDTNAFELLVNKILNEKVENQKANTQELENEIDLRVYKLYDLTHEEVQLVDPEFDMTEAEYKELSY